MVPYGAPSRTSGKRLPMLLATGKNVVAVHPLGAREGTRVEFPDRILIDQIGRDRVPREGLASGQTVSRIDRQFAWVLGLRNNWDLTVGRNDIG